MEPLVTIPMSEYITMKECKDNFQKAFDEKKTILFHDSYFPGHSGYPVHKFTIVNHDVFVEDLINKIKELEEINRELNNILRKTK